MKIKNTLTNPIEYIQNKQPNSIFLNPCTQGEIGKIIDGLKHCATGLLLFIEREPGYQAVLHGL